MFNQCSPKLKSTFPFPTFNLLKQVTVDVLDNLQNMHRYTKIFRNEKKTNFKDDKLKYTKQPVQMQRKGFDYKIIHNKQISLIITHITQSLFTPNPPTIKKI